MLTIEIVKTYPRKRFENNLHYLIIQKSQNYSLSYGTVGCRDGTSRITSVPTLEFYWIDVMYYTESSKEELKIGHWPQG